MIAQTIRFRNGAKIRKQNAASTAIRPERISTSRSSLDNTRGLVGVCSITDLRARRFDDLFTANRRARRRHSWNSLMPSRHGDFNYWITHAKNQLDFGLISQRRILTNDSKLGHYVPSIELARRQKVIHSQSLTP